MAENESELRVVEESVPIPGLDEGEMVIKSLVGTLSKESLVQMHEEWEAIAQRRHEARQSR